jgi:hypothetical protein
MSAVRIPPSEPRGRPSSSGRGLDVLPGVGRAVLEEHGILVHAAVGLDLVEEGASLGLAQVRGARAHASREDDQGGEPAPVQLEAAPRDLQVEVPEADDGVGGDDLRVLEIEVVEENPRVVLGPRVLGHPTPLPSSPVPPGARSGGSGPRRTSSR